ncbi:hypothetical protein L596_025722 [Steinernema carpocapsae]|uniref:Uncharacterized protein n=1 Tax=Steinernema carpocapsae TaxID=34508 RepID=A0A4U5M8U5_STECR|nr:hypothetical protein L596_025722 [Steinernema carpocapsae]
MSKAERLILDDGREMYRFTMTLNPSDGVFTGYVEVLREGDKVKIAVVTERFERVNEYGEQGDCVENFEDLRPLCYCNSLGFSKTSICILTITAYTISSDKPIFVCSDTTLRHHEPQSSFPYFSRPSDSKAVA